MSTTTLFVDLLIVGIQVAIWLGLVVLSLFGYDWVDLQQVRGWETVLAFLALPIVYPLGIFIDDLADLLLVGWQDRIRDQYRTNEKESVMALLMQAADSKLADYYQYVRIKIRLCRSTALNAAIIALGAPVFAVSRLPLPASDKWLLAGALLAFSIVLSAIALFVWHRLTHNFYKRCKIGWDVITGRTKAAPASPVQDKARELLPKVYEPARESLF